MPRQPNAFSAKCCMSRRIEHPKGVQLKNSSPQQFTPVLTTPTPRVIKVDKNAASPKAIADLKAAGILPESVELRQVKYLNNLIEQDHRAHQTLDETGNGLFLVRDGLANLTRIRGDEYDTERASTRSGKRRCGRPGRTGRHTVWSGRLRKIGWVAHARFLFFILFATQPSNARCSVNS